MHHQFPYRWQRKGAGRWVLKSDDGKLAAIIAPTTMRRTRTGTTLKATVMGESRNHSSIAKYGVNHWSLASTVASAKKDIESYIVRHSWETLLVEA